MTWAGLELAKEDVSELKITSWRGDGFSDTLTGEEFEEE
jgi:hypothetical protein